MSKPKRFVFAQGPEEWAPLLHHEGYEISNYGDVAKVIHGRYGGTIRDLLAVGVDASGAYSTLINNRAVNTETLARGTFRPLVADQAIPRNIRARTFSGRCRALLALGMSREGVAARVPCRPSTLTAAMRALNIPYTANKAPAKKSRRAVCVCYHGCGCDDGWHQHADDPCPVHPHLPKY